MESDRWPDSIRISFAAMTLQVLQSRDQIVEGRRVLRSRGLSSLTPGWKTWLVRRRLFRGINVGDDLKSWDVLKTAEFIESKVPKDAALLDIGAFASEIPPILHRMGYRRISALDLNPDISLMPYAGQIDYQVGNFLRAPYPDGSFAAITAISVIEHGFDGQALISEASRLLRPGGYFIASFDYWPDKIPTAGIKMFDMSWTIFSADEVERLFALARQHGLVPCGGMEFEARERPISCAGRDYTFAWMAMQRT